MNVGDLTVEQLVGAIAGAFAIVKLVGEILKLCRDKLNAYYNSRKKNEKKDESLSKHDKAIGDLRNGQELQNIALRTILCNILNDRYIKYRELNYIPEIEASEYWSIHDIYKSLGGNHTGDSKFEWITKNLEIKSED